MKENQVNPQIMDDDEVEIDLRELFFEVKKRLWILAAAILLGGTAGLFLSKVILTPMYTSTSMIYVMSKETTITSLTDLQIGAQLTEDYAVLITSRTVMEKVISNLGLDMDHNELRDKITLNNPSDTRVLEISVVDPDPQMAKTITDEVADCASEYIADIMEQNPPKIIEQGEVPLYKTSPSTAKNTVIGALIGAVLVIGGITVMTLMNDTIKTEDDLERYFGVPVLAAVPSWNEEQSKKAKQKAKERSHGSSRKKQGGAA